MSVKGPEYNQLRGLSYDLSGIIGLTSDLIDTFIKYPSGVTVNDMMVLYRVKFMDYSIEYTRKRKTLLEALDDRIWSEDNLKLDSSVLTSSSFLTAIFKPIEELRSYILSMDSKYSVALFNRENHTKSLSDHRDSCRTARNVMNKYSETLIGTKEGLRDKRAKTLKKIVQNSMSNSGLTSTVLDKDINTETAQNLLTIRYNNNRKQLTQAVSKIEGVLNVGSLADIDVNISSSLVKRMLKKLGQLNREPVIGSSKVGENIEGYWREKVRVRFGGNLPFCDEVDSNGTPILVTDSNGVKRYAKAEDVVDLGDGKFVLKADINLDLLRKSLRSDTYDTY
jgi:hypothetical protein